VPLGGPGEVLVLGELLVAGAGDHEDRVAAQHAED
jgi:hypothetical protein